MVLEHSMELPIDGFTDVLASAHPSGIGLQYAD